MAKQHIRMQDSAKSNGEYDVLRHKKIMAKVMASRVDVDCSRSDDAGKIPAKL